MAKDIQQYVHAATRDNTRRSYQAAVRHFEETWGGFLPATADSMARYLVDHAESHAINTLKQRLAALSQWHLDQGFPDPTKTPLVRKVMRGIRELHPAREKRATPLQLHQLESLDAWLANRLREARHRSDRTALLRCSRDRALVLLGFWRGFRSDELCRLQVQHLDVVPGQGMTLFLPRTKTDTRTGRTFQAPALQRLCPVQAVQDWLATSGLREGALFCGINRWGHLRETGIHPNSVIPLLRKLLTEADVGAGQTFSSHSLRRGFATWANANGWDMKSLMEYVGWRDLRSAMKYVDSTPNFPERNSLPETPGPVNDPK